MLNQKPKIIVIVGPNASGKTDLSLKIAKKFNGEIVSADSRQIYKGMDLGSGKITKKEMRGIPHYMIDVASPKKTFTVAQYVKKANQAIQKILKKNKLPIIVGGSGFYINALVFGINLPNVLPNYTLRKELEKKSAPELFKILKQKDPARAKIIDPHNKRRLIRALEILEKLKKVPKLEINPLYDPLFIGILRSKQELKKRIKKRLIDRIKKGMIEEVLRLRQEGLSWKRLQNFGLEYKYIALYLQNKLTYKQMLQELEKAIWQYSRRQMTWFRKNKNIYWIKNVRQAIKLVKSFIK